MSDRERSRCRVRRSASILLLALLLFALADAVVAPGRDPVEKRRSIPILENVNYPQTGFKRMSSIPLREQPNLSAGKYRHVIRGSRKAFAVTKSKYLKKEWCKTEQLKQVIREKGCRKRKIINRFCYGQCNSFFIPKSTHRGMQTAFRSCSFCKPKVTSWITVTLLCPGQNPRIKRKRIQRIKQCSCMAQTLN
ncbi:Gremlin-1 [Lamellibrachia satsuma]|nr:Gremlin-1 [Lamellibrachia satsuma]